MRRLSVEGRLVTQPDLADKLFCTSPKIPDEEIAEFISLHSKWTEDEITVHRKENVYV
jgi:hypothetical protein